MSCTCPIGTGSKTAHCSACHLTFSTPGNFDRHRRAGACLDPGVCGLVPVVVSWGVVWRAPSESQPREDR